jgi:hypothetical protein
LPTKQKYLCISRKLTKAPHHALKARSKMANRLQRTL